MGASAQFRTGNLLRLELLPFGVGFAETEGCANALRLFLLELQLTISGINVGVIVQIVNFAVFAINAAIAIEIVDGVVRQIHIAVVIEVAERII